MKLRVKLLLSLIVMSVGFIGINASVMASQNLSGTITQDTLLSQDTYNVTSNLTINSGVTVTVEEGSVFRLSSGVALNISGTLITEGTEENRVVITSISDPDYGGSGTTVYWNSICVYGSFNASYTDIKYGGNNSPYNMLITSFGNTYMEDCIIPNIGITSSMLYSTGTGDFKINNSMINIIIKSYNKSNLEITNNSVLRGVLVENSTGGISYNVKINYNISESGTVELNS
jgi:hypothetical protein